MVVVDVDADSTVLVNADGTGADADGTVVDSFTIVVTVDGGDLAAIWPWIISSVALSTVARLTLVMWTIVAVSLIAR